MRQFIPHLIGIKEGGRSDVMMSAKMRERLKSQQLDSAARIGSAAKVLDLSQFVLFEKEISEWDESVTESNNKRKKERKKEKKRKKE